MSYVHNAFRWPARNAAAATALGCLLLLIESSALSAADYFPRLAAAVPKTAAECDAAHLQSLQKAADDVDRWAAALAWQRNTSPSDTLSRVGQIITGKAEVDRYLNQVLKLRSQIAPLVEQKNDREFARKYFAITSQLIDLSGRLRFTLRDAINNAISYFTQIQSVESGAELLELVTSRNAYAAASVFAPYLSNLEAPLSLKHKRHVIDLIGRSGEAELIPALVDTLRTEGITPDLKLSAGVAIVNIGVPQDWRPSQSDEEPKPPITARELWAELAKLQFGPEYDASYARLRGQLLARLKELSDKGNVNNAIRTCGIDVHVGDWLLIRNPSPYNQVTDLAPGLFTHVGVVAAEKASDGRTRLVVVEVPERGDRVPATNVDAYLARTLHFFFLRHPDDKIAGHMAAVAADVIGNETQFDLGFRNEHVVALKGKPLKGERIHTYCAGLLHLCAQETGAPLSDFFPLVEGPPGGHCLANLKKLGMSIGADFVSPTGALLSPKLEIVGRREPMYDPGREVKEAVYDHFAYRLINSVLTPSPDAVQALREKLAGLAKYNPLLAKALAQANNVSEHMDLESAAKAAAVIETLDEFADEAMFDYLDARRAMNRFDESQLTAEEKADVGDFRTTHAELYKRSLAGTISPRDLRVTLVKYYAAEGKRRLDERFFKDAK
jgi:hypothetical protein